MVKLVVWCYLLCLWEMLWPIDACVYVMEDYPDTQADKNDFDIGCALLANKEHCRQSCLEKPSCTAAMVITDTGLIIAECCLASGIVSTLSAVDQHLGPMRSFTISIKKVMHSVPGFTGKTSDYDMVMPGYDNEDKCVNACLVRPQCLVAEYKLPNCYLATWSVGILQKCGSTIFKKLPAFDLVAREQCEAAEGTETTTESAPVATITTSAETTTCEVEMVDYANTNGDVYDKLVPGIDLEDCKQQCLSDPTCLATEFSETYYDYYYYAYYDEPTCFIATGPLTTSNSETNTVSRKQCVTDPTP